MSATVITYDRAMGRWEPNARGRLAQAALTLYAQQGFEQTTAAEIARLAGLTERTFFRHFADKREVLFYGMDVVGDVLVRAVAQAPSSAGPMDAVGAGLQAVAEMVQETPEIARMRSAVVSANPELRERELAKHAELAAAMAGGLRDRGVPALAASLATETGLAVYRVAFARWIAEPALDLREILREALEELRDLLAGHLVSSPSAS
jgi:AcrR family transcriptional regulator